MMIYYNFDESVMRVEGERYDLTENIYDNADLSSNV